MHDCLLLFIICAKSLSVYTQPYSPTTFKLQHIHYTHTYEPPERLPPESQYILASMEDQSTLDPGM